MSLKIKAKKVIKALFGKRPIYLTAQVTQLTPSELVKNRTALITGGTSGIGFAIAESMLRGGGRSRNYYRKDR